MKPSALILHAIGTNRDPDVAEALSLAGADAQIVHINQLKSGEKQWADYQLLVIAGGFSYADALGAGKLLAIDLNAYFLDKVRRFITDGKPVIGICNGFQTLVKSGLIFEDDRKQPVIEGTLSFNQAGHFECRWVTMKAPTKQCVWLREGQQIECPIAHGEGNFILKDQAMLKTLQERQMIALQYTQPNGELAQGQYPYNPNGSVADIAGICNPAGNVLGLMPHPENNIYPFQHPHRTRKDTQPSGLQLFINGVNYAKEM